MLTAFMKTVKMNQRSVKRVEKSAASLFLKLETSETECEVKRAKVQVDSLLRQFRVL